MTRLGILAGALLLLACREQTAVQRVDEQTDFLSEAEAGEEVATSSGPDGGADDPEADEELEFKGYHCTQDCSGHQAGYDWAEEKGITDPDTCGGNSQSFIEGCRAYAEEQSDYGFDDEWADESRF